MRQASELRPYQQDIVTALYQNDEKIAVVRPGGGKTICALTAFAELKRDGAARHALILAPKRVARATWPDELALWSHTQGLRYAILTGSPQQRASVLNEIGDLDLTILGLDLTKWLLDELNRFPPDHPLFDLLILDEASRLRNPTGVRAKALAKAAGRWRMIWGLSGTLRPSSSLDLFMPARVVTRGKLWGPSYYKWRQERFYQADYRGYTWLPMPGAEDRLNAEIAPLTVTLREEDLPQLPELSIIFDRVELPDDARRHYDRMHEKLTADVGPVPVLAASAGVATGKLAQIANGFLYDNAGMALPMHDEKRAWLEDIVEDATGPTILVYQYLEDLAMIRDVVGEDIPYLGAGVSDKQAELNIQRWNAGELPFLALHPASAGHGLNLQHGGADMAWIAPTWDPEAWEQTIARLHRSGQTQPVMVRVCTAAHTVDGLKIDRVHHKMTAQAAFEAYLRDYQEERNSRSAKAK